MNRTSFFDRMVITCAAIAIFALPDSLNAGMSFAQGFKILIMAAAAIWVSWYIGIKGVCRIGYYLVKDLSKPVWGMSSKRVRQRG